MSESRFRNKHTAIIYMSVQVKKLFILFFVLLVSSFLQLQAQQYLADVETISWYQKGMDLLDKHQYGAAREAFEEYLEEDQSSERAVEAEYYIAYAALRLYNADGEAKLAEFVNNHSSHPKAVRANYELGNFYFKDENYGKAIAYFEKTDTRNLTEEEQHTRNFKLGYAYFTEQNFYEAKPYFDQVKVSRSPFTSAASYYSGYIAYQQSDFEEALSDLKSAEQEASYAEVVPYLIANIYYKQGKYAQLQTYAQGILDGAGGNKSQVKNLPDIMLLAGEAYFMQGDYAKAEPFLSEYATLRRPEAPMMYRLAFAQYKTGKAQPAIDNFKQIASRKDSIGQFSSYYLGLSYLKQDNENFASTALENAANMSFSPEIKEQASFKLGKVLVSLGEHGRAIQTLQKFKEDYPNSEHTVEANDLLSEAFLNTQNYAQAIEFIESLPTKTLQVRKAYQKVSFYAGTQAFNQGEYYQSVQLFDKSLQYPIDRELVAGANFWKGEAYSVGKKYEEAINAYAAVFRALGDERRLEGTSEMYFLKSRYGIGYAYFNTNDYPKAKEHFEKYVQTIEQKSRGNTSAKLNYEDALIRLADTYYVTKNYGQAIGAYDKAIQQRNPDISYAYYQKGVIQGIQGKMNEARASLDVVIDRYPDSRHRDDAVFQKAQLNLEEGNYQQAINGFSRLLQTNAQSNLTPYALLRRALAYTNLKNYAQASADYKQVIKQYTDHAAANSALLGLQEVQSQSGEESDDFSEYLAIYKEANPENKALGGIEFESAKNLYFTQKYQQAVSRLQEFISNYPDNANVDEARYYIAESYYRSDQIDEALKVFYEIAGKGSSSRLNRAIQRIAELEQAQNNHQQAIKYYARLANMAGNKREQFNAWSGMMTSYYILGQKNESLLDSVNYYAEQILEKANVSAAAENMAMLYQGKVAYEKENYDKAIDNFLKTLNTAKDTYGAEAQYLMAKIQYDQGKYAESIETLYDLNKNFSIYENWLGLSFLLIAENYIALEENFQAKATLNSLIENSPLPNIREQAEQKLMALGEMEAEKEAEERKQDSMKMEQENQIIIDESSPEGSKPKQ
ncbi:tetratricopeptide repeat protein [Catalinimonas niigatensis]|uniref:tetratricopeptide repeat protein n=1 Tax=Catalinimonas niigatensis TaxID=1397264 RepID=UPI0026668BA6|nr:tetratricopeptide repeat protein [Catalinimonas niigatensis]WPP52537.1 tetratricopeptide repeat protein [Catalinimonas niigatensis]